MPFRCQGVAALQCPHCHRGPWRWRPCRWSCWWRWRSERPSGWAGCGQMPGGERWISVLKCNKKHIRTQLWRYLVWRLKASENKGLTLILYTETRYHWGDCWGAYLFLVFPWCPSVDFNTDANDYPETRTSASQCSVANTHTHVKWNTLPEVMCQKYSCF